MRVGNGLGIYYGDVLKEAIPDQFAELTLRMALARGDLKWRANLRYSEVPHATIEAP